MRIIIERRQRHDYFILGEYIVTNFSFVFIYFRVGIREKNYRICIRYKINISIDDAIFVVEAYTVSTSE